MNEQRAHNQKWSNSKTTSSNNAAGILVVSVSLFLWLLVDTFIAVVPPSNSVVFQENKITSAKAIANAYPNADFVHLWWLVQISDIHISSYRNFHIPANLKLFLTEVIPTVNPVAVLATGDLTDAKLTNILHSRQEISEWQKYRQLLNNYLTSMRSSAAKSDEGTNENDHEAHETDSKITWIDMRGNHDKFDVGSNVDDLYSKFSPFAHQWKANSRHVTHKFTVNDTVYAVVATDATPSPGFRRPYNFFGVLSEETLDHFRETDNALAKDGVQLAIWSGHYPGSAIFVGGSVSSQRSLLNGEFIRHGAVYLCGHLHTVYDAELALYARHPPLGQLELELADFQRSERFRLLAVDHGLLSFTDVSLHQWPIVLVTNPKEALFSMPNHEPLEKIALSTHIRILAFSTSQITDCIVTLNGKFLGNATRNKVNSALYTVPWTPSQLTDSTFHHLEVLVRDASGRSITERVTFFVDPKTVSQLPSNIGGPFAPFILLSNIPKLTRNGFLLSTLFCVIVLLTARLFPNSSRFLPCKSVFHGLVVFASLPCRLFASLLLVIIYPVFGPWFVGEVLASRFALIFAHGILLVDDGTFIPDAVTAFQGFINVLTFFVPLLLYFSWVSSSAFTTRWRAVRIIQRLILQSLILWQLWAAYCDAQAYGWTAFFFNPLRTWTPVFVAYFDIQFRKNCMRKL